VPAEPRADVVFPLEFHRRQEKILQQAQVGIHDVHRLERGRRVIPHVAQQLAHVGPVLLLDMRVVVLRVRPSPRELNLVGAAVAHQVRVDEFGAVVRVNAAQRENGKAARNASSRACTPRTWLFPMTAPCSTQVVWISVRFSVCTKSPSARSPE
jgi:hypothetical protein